MKLSKKLKIASGMLKNAKLRSWLTIIGIVIAVASVTMILSFGEGINNEVENKLGSSGLGIYNLRAGYSWDDNEQIIGNTQITYRDFEFLNDISYIDEVSRNLNLYTTVNYFGEEYSLSIAGTDLENFESFNELKIISGELLQKGDSKIIILSQDTINQTFPEDFKPEVGDLLEIGSQQFLLGGIFDSTDFLSFSLNSGFISLEDLKELKEEINSQDENYTEYDEFGNLKSDVYDTISVKFNSQFKTKIAKEKLISELIKFRDSDRETKNFNLEGKDDILKEINKVVDIVTWVLVGFASISILVGSVGVANTMYTSVIEKTKEIGIMKAIGAKDSDIEHIFLLNSGLLGLAGGIIGVTIGLSFALITGIVIIYLSKMQGLSLWSLISFKIIFGSLLFSILIGMVSGYFPAKNAAAQDPVVALRGE